MKNIQAHADTHSYIQWAIINAFRLCKHVLVYITGFMLLYICMWEFRHMFSAVEMCLFIFFVLIIGIHILYTAVGTYAANTRPHTLANSLSCHFQRFYLFIFYLAKHHIICRYFPFSWYFVILSLNVVCVCVQGNSCLQNVLARDGSRFQQSFICSFFLY